MRSLRPGGGAAGLEQCTCLFVLSVASGRMAISGKQVMMPQVPCTHTCCCTCCRPCCRTEREDELHLLTCLYHVGARRIYLGDAMTAGVGDTFGDAWMRQAIPGHEPGGGGRLEAASGLPDHCTA